MNAATSRILLLSLFVLASACDMDGGPILVPDGGHDAGPEPDGGTDAGDQQAPEVVETTPAHGATGVAADATIVIRFSEAMNESAGTVAIDVDGAAAGAPAASWSEDGTTLTLTPAAALASSARVRVTVRADFADLSGNTLEGPTVFAFDVADVEPPRATASTPAEGATGVPGRLDAIEIVFNEAMSATGTLTLEGGDGTVGDPVWSTASVRFPVRGLEYDTAYRVVLDGFTDAAGNALDGAAYLGDGALDFTTGADVDGPVVVDSNPDEGQVNVSLRFLDAIVVELDEPMDTSVTEVELTVPGAVRALTGTWSADARTITFPLLGELAPNGAHSLDLSALRDAAGNALDGVAYLFDGRLDFVTGADDVVPAVVFATPGEGTVEATFRDSELRLVFNQAMDTSTTTLAFDDGTGPVDLTGTWNLAGTRLTFDVTGRLRSETSYTLDAREMRDATGRPVDVSHSYLVDGILDFTTIAGNGENCRDALTVPTSTTATGGLVFEIGERQVIDDDGSMSCDTNGIPADAVIRYRKTSAEGGTAGGRWLRIRAADAVGGTGPSNRVNVEVYRGSCDPNAAEAASARELCLFDRGAWEVLIPAPPGDYFVWVSHHNGSTFREIHVTIEEQAEGPGEGETCDNPFTTATAAPLYTAPTAANPYHVWDLPEGVNQLYSYGPTNRAPDTMSCDDDDSNGQGVDSVIRFDKAASDSVLDVTVETFFTHGDGLNFEVRDACDPRVADGSVACLGDIRYGSGTEPQRRRMWLRGDAGPRFFWISAANSFYGSAPARVIAREVPASPGIDCSNAIPITPGTTVPVTPVAERLFPPSCAPATANLTWYRMTATQYAMMVTGTTTDATPGAVALIDPATDGEISCTANIAGGFQSAFVDIGEEVCIAVESDRVASLTVEAIPYAGNRGIVTDLEIGAPWNATGTSRRTMTAQTWLAASPTALYQGLGSQGLVTAPITGGIEAADFRDDFGSFTRGNLLGNDAVTVGETLFSLDDTSTAASPRVYRLVRDGSFEPAVWDTGSAYPGVAMYAIAYDGTSLVYASRANPATFFSLSATAPGPATALGAASEVRDVSGIAADATYLYVVGRTDATAATEGVFRLDRADLSAPALRLATVDISTVRCSIELDDLAAPTHLYFRADDGSVHVITDPAGASPRHLGAITSAVGNPSNDSMTIDRVTGALYVTSPTSSSSTPDPYYRLD